MNETYLSVLIMIGALGGGLWILYSRKFVNHLCKNYPDTYKALGNPPMELKRYYTPNEISAMLSLTGYIISAGYRNLHDRNFIRFSERLRTLFFVDGLLVVAIFVLFFLSFNNQNQREQISGKAAASSPVQLAYKKYQSHDYQESLRILNELIDNEPDNSDAYYYRGFTNEALRNYPDALTDFIKVTKLEPDKYDAYAHIDWLYAKNKDWDKIITYWTKYLKRNPDDAKAHLERGGTYFQAGNLEKALIDARRACDLGNKEGCQRYAQGRGMLSGN